VTSLAALENARETLHCENDQTKPIGFSRTGMFNLIVKDPRRIPPERAALDQGIHSLAVCPRTCCTACGGYHFCSTSALERISQRY
jgi:hypothetical protein